MSEEIKEQGTEVTEETTEPTESTEPTEESSEPSTPTDEPTDVEETLEEKGINLEELKKEYAENGDLTAETKAKLNKLGLSDEFINDYIESKKAQIEAQIAKEQNELIESVGDKETFNNIIQWAAKNLSTEEKESLNSIRDMTVQKLVLSGLKSRMDKAEGKTPTFVTGGQGGAVTETFASQAEMFAAMRDKRYKTDPAYKEKVVQKISNSRAAGINLGI